MSFLLARNVSREKQTHLPKSLRRQHCSSLEASKRDEVFSGLFSYSVVTQTSTY